MVKMNFISSSIIITIVLYQNCLILCSIDRPTRREIQSNKTVFVHLCVNKGICKDYTDQNGLSHINCDVLCDLSWKWAQSEVNSDPLFTLPPNQDLSETFPLLQEPVGNYNSSDPSGRPLINGQELRERPAQSKKHIGKQSVGYHNDGVAKSEDQVKAEKRKHKKATDTKKSALGSYNKDKKSIPELANYQVTGSADASATTSEGSSEDSSSASSDASSEGSSEGMSERSMTEDSSSASSDASSEGTSEGSSKGSTEDSSDSSTPEGMSERSMPEESSSASSDASSEDSSSASTDASSEGSSGDNSGSPSSEGMSERSMPDQDINDPFFNKRDAPNSQEMTNHM